MAVQHSYHHCVYCRAPSTSLCSDNTQNLYRSTVEQIPKHLRSKVNSFYIILRAKGAVSSAEEQTNDEQNEQTWSHCGEYRQI